MTLLLDTHAVIWWFEDSTQLSMAARDAISRPENRDLISAASAWEIAIKRSLGKLTTPNDLEQVVRESGFEWLPITPKHALAVEHLPMIHRDPFDRLLVVQAIIENAVMLTRDGNVTRYGISTMLV